ncbi:hypothetical protein RRG08_003742 [Elysia crispata]|uniref:G-protein coupled receptors family 1 profile domain-containing protein n=1 Tax=Elysia crispata TaxID=231223 RepID=A0AAE1E503_9GAST|nr:hypothetical protein RRG08_003742 [Elysia crispata]
MQIPTLRSLQNVSNNCSRLILLTQYLMVSENSTVGVSPDRGNMSGPDYSHCKYYLESPDGIQCYLSDQHMMDEIYAFLALTPLEWVISCLYVLVFVTGVSGNFLVCYAVWRNKYLRTITNCFLTNLALADFLTIVFCLPPSFAQTIFETWFLGRALCKTIIYLQLDRITAASLCGGRQQQQEAETNNVKGQDCGRDWAQNDSRHT